MTEISAKCILKTAPSKSFEDYALVTVLVELPYYVWAELLTHKRFVRNAASNRAMPVERNIDLGYYMPEFREKGRGMTAGQLARIDTQRKAREIWEAAWENAVAAAKLLDELGVAKEQSSRILPTCKMIRGLVTGTVDAWYKFFELRLSEKADFAMQEVADEIYWNIVHTATVYSSCHVPFSEKYYSNIIPLRDVLSTAGKIAHLSFGSVSETDSIELGKRLLRDHHWSPFEHIAKWIESPVPSALCTKDGDVYVSSQAGLFGWENFRATAEVVDAEKILATLD